MSTGCERFELLISRELDNDLSVSEEAALREHLRVCPDCRALARAMSAASTALRDCEVEPPEALAGSVMERIGAFSDVPKRRRAARPWARVLLAACLILVIGIGGFAAWVGTWRAGSSGASAEKPVMEAAIVTEEEEAESAAEEADTDAPLAAEAPAAAMPEPETNEDSAPAERVFTAEDGGAGYAVSEAAAIMPEEMLSQFAARYTLDAPALVPAGREADFEALLTSAGIEPNEERAVFAYVEYRGVIWEFSTDGEQLIWRDAAEGYPTVSSASPIDLIDILS